MSETKEQIEEKGLINEAREAANALQLQLDRKKELLDREEKLMAMNLLRGRAEGGITPVAKDPKEAQKERINHWLKDTGLKI